MWNGIASVWLFYQVVNIFRGEMNPKQAVFKNCSMSLCCFGSGGKTNKQKPNNNPNKQKPHKHTQTNKNNNKKPTKQKTEKEKVREGVEKWEEEVEGDSTEQLITFQKTQSQDLKLCHELYSFAFMLVNLGCGPEKLLGLLWRLWSPLQ